MSCGRSNQFFAWVLAAGGLSAAVSGCRTGAPATGLSSPPPAALAAYTRGQAAEKSGHPGDALAWYRRAWERDPTSMDAPRRMVDLLGNLAGLDVAARCAEEVRTRRPEAPEPWRWLARIRLAQERIPEALQAAEEAARRAPADASAHVEWAQLLRLAERPSDALAVLRAAAATAQPLADLLKPAGELYVAARKDSPPWAGEAAATLQDLAARAGKDAEAQNMLGAIYRTAGQTAEALTALRRAQALAPDDARVYLQLTAVLIAAQRGSEVIGLLETALGRVRSGDDLRQALAQLYQRRADENRESPNARRDRQRAIDCLETASGHQPRNASLVVQLALARMAAQQPRLAFAALLRRLPDDPAVRAGAVRALIDQYPAADLERQWTKALGVNGADARGAYFLGLLAEARHQPEAARRAYERAAAAPQPDSSAFQRLVLMNVGTDPAAARRWVDAGLAHRPDDAALLEISGRLYLVRREFAAAARSFQGLETSLAAAENSDALSAARVLLAVARQSAAQPEAAEESLRAALTDHDAAAVLEFYVQQALRLSAQTGVDTQITRDRLARLESDPALALPAHLCRGLFELETGNPASSLAAFDAALKAAPSFDGRPLLGGPFFYLYAQALDRAGRPADAATALRECLQRRPDHAAALNHLAYLAALNGGDLAEAERFSRRALRAEPDHAAFLDTLGWVLFKQDRPEDALVELRKAERQGGAEEPEILDHLGEVLDRLGRAAEAEEYWSRAFVCDPNLPGLKGKLLMRGINLAPLQRAADARRLRSGVPDAGRP